MTPITTDTTEIPCLECVGHRTGIDQSTPRGIDQYRI
jgi:hypothetical protein